MTIPTQARHHRVAQCGRLDGWLDVRADLQDVVQYGPLGLTLVSQMLSDPLFVPAIFRHVGIPPMLDWLKHFTALGAYTLLHKAGKPVVRRLAQKSSGRRRFKLNRLLDAWKYGSGSDFRL